MEFECYSLGLVSASVCTSLTPQEATKRMNEKHPTGIRSSWAVSESPTFSGGESNPCMCPDHAGNKHYLFNC